MSGFTQENNPVWRLDQVKSGFNLGWICEM